MSLFRSATRLSGFCVLAYSTGNHFESRILIGPLVSHTLPLADFPDALDMFARGETLKV